MSAEPTLDDLLRRCLREHADRPAVRDRSARWTYRELAARAECVAGGLRGRGVRPGDRIVCLLPSGCAAVALAYAAVRLGAVLVPIDCDTSVYRLRWLLADADARLVVTDADRMPLVGEAGGPAAVAFGDLERGDPLPGPEPPIAPDTVALMFYTSGTTAHPRAVVCPAGRVAFVARAISTRLRYRPTDVVLCRLPLSFDYGFYQILLCALGGAELVLAAPGDDVGLLAVAERTGTTVLPVVPTLATLLCRLGARGGALSGVRLVTNTGAALSAPLAAGLRKALPGSALVFMYGMTECKRISISTPNDDLCHPGSVGTALPGTLVRVLGPRGEPLPHGGVGQIVVSGPHVMAGYWHAPESSARVFRADPAGGGHALYTGDYGWLDETGRLYFAGRRDELFKRQGIRTSAQEIEAALLDIPGVDAAAAAVDADDRLVVWVVGECTEYDVKLGVAQRLGRARVPDHCVLLRALPTTHNGKVDKSRLLGTVRSVERW